MYTYTHITRTSHLHIYINTPEFQITLKQKVWPRMEVWQFGIDKFGHFLVFVALSNAMFFSLLEGRGNNPKCPKWSFFRRDKSLSLPPSSEGKTCNGHHQATLCRIYTQSLTWNLKMMVSNWFISFPRVPFYRFHVLKNLLKPQRFWVTATFFPTWPWRGLFECFPR